MKQPKVLIGCPITEFKESVIDKYIQGIQSLSYKNSEVLLLDNSPTEKMFNKLKQIKGINVQKTEHISSLREMLVRDRNVLREKTLKGGFDFFLSLEQDIVAPSNAIELLLENKKLVCSGMYFKFFDIIAPKGPVSIVRPVFSSWLDEEQKEVKLVKQLNFNDAFPSRLFKVAGGGIGCVLIDAKVLQKIKFRFDKKFNSFEDVWFAKDCEDNGIDFWIDSSIVCAHFDKESPWPQKIIDDVWD